ncbi:g5938 [Coccomyxa elongata]
MPASKPTEAAGAAEPPASCGAAEQDPKLRSNKRRKTATSTGSGSAFAALVNAAIAAQVSTAAAPSSHAVPPDLPMPPETPDAAGEERCSWFTTGPRSAGGLAVASGCSLAAAGSLSGAFNSGDARHFGGTTYDGQCRTQW